MVLLSYPLINYLDSAGAMASAASNVGGAAALGGALAGANAGAGPALTASAAASGQAAQAAQAAANATMNNGRKDTTHSDVQKLQQQLNDIKEQVLFNILF